MATDVELPQLGESVTEGTITAWLVSVGDTVEADQPLFELSSDKIDTEVPAPTAGVVTEILVEVDETVEVGTVVARIGEADEASTGGSDEGSSGSGQPEEQVAEEQVAEEQVAEEQVAEEQVAEEDVADEAVAASEAESTDDEEPHDAGADDGPAADGEPELHGDEDGGGAAEGPEPAAEPEAGAGPEAGTDEGSAGGGGSGAGGPAVDIVLPELGESVTEGTITAWLVSVGDEVTEDQPLFELSSDKIDTEVPSPAAGVVSEILVEVDETVDVGTVVARLGGSGGSDGSDGSGSADGAASTGGAEESAAKSASDGAEESAGDYEQVPDDVATPAAASKPAGPDALASPLVRKLAADNGVDLGSLKGTGQGGRITRDDVEAAMGGGDASAPAASEPAPETAPAKAAQKPAAKPAVKAAEPAGPAREPGERERVEDLSRIRQRIADKMIESQANAAQLTTVQECDVTALMNARTRHKDAFKSREGVSLSPFAIVARAALMAVRNHPMLNAAADWDHGKLYLRDYVNLGIAVDTPKGLLVPNVKGADSLTVAGLARGIAEAAQKARGEGGKRLDFADIEGGTFTLTNTGSVGVLIDTPILNYPEVAILGVGAIVKRPAVVTAADGTEAIAIRNMMYLSLTYDHRLLDGADAARFVTEVKHVLEGTDWDQEIG